MQTAWEAPQGQLEGSTRRKDEGVTGWPGRLSIYTGVASQDSPPNRNLGKFSCPGLFSKGTKNVGLLLSFSLRNFTNTASNPIQTKQMSENRKKKIQVDVGTYWSLKLAAMVFISAVELDIQIALALGSKYIKATNACTQFTLCLLLSEDRSDSGFPLSWPLVRLLSPTSDLSCAA